MSKLSSTNSSKRTNSTGIEKGSCCSLTPHSSIKEKVSIPLTKIVKYNSQVPALPAINKVSWQGKNGDKKR